MALNRNIHSITREIWDELFCELLHNGTQLPSPTSARRRRRQRQKKNLNWDIFSRFGHAIHLAMDSRLSSSSHRIVGHLFITNPEMIKYWTEVEEQRNASSFTFSVFIWIQIPFYTAHGTTRHLFRTSKLNWHGGNRREIVGNKQIRLLWSLVRLMCCRAILRLIYHHLPQINTRLQPRRGIRQRGSIRKRL